jgi:hypothetical protein
MTHLLHISLFHLLTSAIIGRGAREEESAAGTATICCKCFQIICSSFHQAFQKLLNTMVVVWMVLGLQKWISYLDLSVGNLWILVINADIPFLCQLSLSLTHDVK